MSVEAAGDIIRLSGRCRVEDAEALLAALLEEGGRPVDLSACQTLHSAVVQVLLAAKPAMVGAPADPALARWLMPLLAAGGEAFGLGADRL